MAVRSYAVTDRGEKTGRIQYGDAFACGEPVTRNGLPEPKGATIVAHETYPGGADAVVAHWSKCVETPSNLVPRGWWCIRLRSKCRATSHTPVNRKGRG